MSKATYQLADGATSFYDDESDLKIVAGETVELDEDKVTPKTATALMSGGLVKVKVQKGKVEKTDEGDDEGDAKKTKK